MVLLEAQGRGAAPDRRLVQKKPPQTSFSPPLRPPASAAPPPPSPEARLDDIPSWIPSNLRLQEVSDPLNRGKRQLRPHRGGGGLEAPEAGVIKPGEKVKVAGGNATNMSPAAARVKGKNMSTHEVMTRIEHVFNVVQEAAAGEHAGLDKLPAEELEYVSRRSRAASTSRSRSSART